MVLLFIEHDGWGEDEGERRSTVPPLSQGSVAFPLSLNEIIVATPKEVLVTDKQAPLQDQTLGRLFVGHSSLSALGG